MEKYLTTFNLNQLNILKKEDYSSKIMFNMLVSVEFVFENKFIKIKT